MVRQGEFVAEAETEDRVVFVAKVYGVLAVQYGLATPIGLACIDLLQHSWMQWNLVVVALVAVLIVAVFFAIYDLGVRQLRRTPVKLFLLLALTAALGCATGILDVFLGWQTSLLVSSVLCVGHAVVAVAAFASKSDFVCIGLWPYALAGVIDLMVLAWWIFLAMVLGFGTNWLGVVVSVTLVLAISSYVMYEVRSFVKGYNEVRVYLDEWIFAALLMHFDLINTLVTTTQLAVKAFFVESPAEKDKTKAAEEDAKKSEEQPQQPQP